MAWPKNQPARPEAQPAHLNPGLASRPGWLNRRTDGQMDRWKSSPFYRTLSSLGAAALLPPKKIFKNLIQKQKQIRARELTI